MAAKKKPKPVNPAHRPPERFKSDLPYTKAVKKALAKKKPPGGWPKPGERSDRE